MSSDLDDLQKHATSQHDFYELLGFEPGAEPTEAEIKRAYRKTSLKYHPDKNPGDLTVVEKFHLIGIARDVLLTPETKALHDKTRAARVQKQRQHDLFEGRRRMMKEDLERRESGFKRRREEEEDEAEKRERELRRLAEDGKRRRREMEEKAKRSNEEEASVLEDTAAAIPTPTPTGEPETERRVFIRFVREGEGLSFNETTLSSAFSRYGKIENVYILRERKTRLSGEKHRKLVATAAITYERAYDAFLLLADKDNLAPTYFDINGGAPKAEEDSTSVAPSTPMASPALKKSFRASIGSFTGGAASPAFSFSPLRSGAASNQDVTMERLRAAQKEKERRRLEEEIRKEEAAAAAEG